MTYKIRRFKTKIQAVKGLETSKTVQLQKEIHTLNSKIENLNLELRCKSCELEQIKFSKEIDKEVNSLIMSVFTSDTDEDKFNENLAVLDTLMNNLTRQLLDVFYLGD